MDIEQYTWKSFLQKNYTTLLIEVHKLFYQPVKIELRTYDKGHMLKDMITQQVLY